jgi:diacylglycerol kinase family enzyme
MGVGGTVIAFLNRRAGQGRASKKWDAVRSELERRFGSFETVPADSLDGVRETVARAVAGGENVVIAAGGDGTVNLLVNALMITEGAQKLALGAVGLGSSNDFHKPVRSLSMIEGVPTRIDCQSARGVDVIRIDYESDDQGGLTRFAIINASVGITAEANASFDSDSRFIRAASKLSVDAGIVASVIRTLATYSDIPCRISVDGHDEGEFLVTNLGVVKNPHFAGSFCYDTQVDPDDGKLGINLCERLSSLQVLATLAALSRTRFRGRPKTRCWTGERVAVEGRREFAVEMDGEVVRARRAEFAVLRGRIRCCQ